MTANDDRPVWAIDVWMATGATIRSLQLEWRWPSACGDEWFSYSHMSVLNFDKLYPAREAVVTIPIAQLDDLSDFVTDHIDSPTLSGMVAAMYGKWGD